ncbi:MAG: RagB/SusD family nutrient uptake outer membrane protein, partial [Bacteroidales bacterium]|nr:RagB/SusD family nutrient uptake outer membrane protein [Bacteroidales bacterium]
AMAGINNPGPYALEDTYYDLWVGSNLYSKEALLFADYTTANEKYNGSGLTGYQGGDGQNSAFWMMNPNYTNLQVAVTDKPAVIENGKESFQKTDDGKQGNAQAIGRAGEQGYGRPWARMAPVHGVFYHTFADLRDSRLDVTFNMTYKQNATRIKGQTVYGAQRQKLEKDAAVLKFIPNQPKGAVSYPSDRGAAANGANSFGAGTMEGENAYVIEYNHIGRRNFVGPWKRSIWLTTGSTDKGILKTDDSYGQTNIGNPTPNVIARFAEFYFVAAEAAIKGASGGQAAAHELMSVIRARAGKWTHSVAEGTALQAKEVSRDYSAELVAEIPAVIDIDWLLDEYSREFFAEYRRWYDLVRTQTWIERASTYLMGEDYNKGDTMEKEWKRDIQKKHYIRPIPVGQLNGLDMSDEEMAAYQNPGYDR